MIEIKVLGPGCPNCQEMERRVKQALAGLNVQADVIKVLDLKEIGKYIMMTPGLVINGTVKHSGKPLPKVERITEWIKGEIK